jgi:hypothetical protein
MHTEVPLLVEQAAPQPPQWAALMRRSTSQPFAGLLSQSAKTASHAPSRQTPASQRAEALANAHARRHAPQWVGLTRRSASQPFAAFSSQLS